MPVRDILNRAENCSWHSKSMANTMLEMAIGRINADSTLLNENKNLHDEAQKDDFHLCRVAHKIKLPLNNKAAVLIYCQGTELMTTETNHNVVED